MSNKNERKGTVDQATGKIKQAVGTLTRSDNLKADGRADGGIGEMEAAVGRAIARLATRSGVSSKR